MAKFLFNDLDIIKLLVREEQASGGAAVQSFIWVRGLRDLGHRVFLLKDIDDHREIKSEWSDIRILPLYSSSKGIRWIRWVYYRFPKFFALLRREDPDYVYESNPGWTTFFTGVFCRLLNIKLIIRIPLDAQLDERYREDHSWAHVFLMNLGMRLSYCILCQNDYQMDLVQHKFPKKRSLKVYNPFVFPVSNKALEIKKEEYIVWVANFRYQKNLKLLYGIAKLCTSYEFRIVGSTSSMKDLESIEYFEKLKKLPNVNLLGFIPRKYIMETIGRAKFLLNTSRYEGFSNTFLEAMHMGTPILSTQNVNPDNIISNHNLGAIYSSPMDLGKQLAGISETGYIKMSENCKAFVKENHDYLILTDKLINFLENH